MATDESDLEKALSDLSKTAAHADADADKLRATRQFLTSGALARQLDEAKARLHNQPAAVAELEDRLRAIKFAYRDLRADREERRQQLAILLTGGGSALAGSGLLAVGTQAIAFPPLALLVIGVGAYAAWRGTMESRRLAFEISYLDDIVEALDRGIERLQEKR